MAVALEACNVSLYTDRDPNISPQGTKTLLRNGQPGGLMPSHRRRLADQLSRLDQARTPEDMAYPAWRLHPLSGNLRGHYAVTVSGNWRLTFAFDNGDVVLVDYQDYH